MSIDLASVEQMHDLLLAHQPSGASHDASTCPYCVASEDGADAHIDDTPSGGGDMSTYTQEELQAAVETAVAPIQAELDGLRTSQEQAAIEARINELAVAHEAEKAELQAQLDQAHAEAEASKRAHDEIVAFLEEATVEAERQAVLEARRDEVKTAVSNLFSDEYVEENLDRWASMEAEAFEAQVADWNAAVAAAATSDKGEEKPDPLKTTAMQASADSGDETTDLASVRRNLYKDRRGVRHVGASTR